MGDMRERINHAIEEEKKIAEIESMEARGIQKVRDHLAEKAAEKARAERLLVLDRAKKVLRVLDRIRVREFLGEVNRDVWEGVGEIRDEFVSDGHLSIDDLLSDKSIFPKIIRRKIGLSHVFNFNKLVPSDFVSLKREGGVASTHLFVVGSVDIEDKEPKRLSFTASDNIYGVFAGL